MKLHTFPSTEAAYDATQTDERITNGDVLHIPSEGVVGLADTWPVAVTVAHGELHTLKDGVQAPDFLANHDITAVQLATAVAVARKLDYPINPQFLRGGVMETWIDPEERAYPNGGFTRRGRVVLRRNSHNPIALPYGEVRAVRLSIADTYFSIPARLRYRGKTVAGYVWHDDGAYYFTPNAEHVR